MTTSTLMNKPLGTAVTSIVAIVLTLAGLALVWTYPPAPVGVIFVPIVLLAWQSSGAMRVLMLGGLASLASLSAFALTFYSDNLAADLVANLVSTGASLVIIWLIGLLIWRSNIKASEISLELNKKDVLVTNLLESETRLTDIFSNSPVGLGIFNDDATLVLSNKEFQRIITSVEYLADGEEESSDTSPWPLLADIEQNVREKTKIRTEDNIIEFGIQREDGICLEIVGGFSDIGNFIATVTDVTTREIEKAERTAYLAKIQQQLDASEHVREQLEADRDIRAESKVSGLLPTLVVDDDHASLALVSRALRLNGSFDVHTARDGLEAKKIVEASDVKFALVVCDWEMPKMDGLEFLEYFKPGNPDVPFVMLTGKTSEHDFRRAKNKGANHFFMKPLDIPDLSARIKSIFALAAGDT
jgi:two-component system, chemotaxis family, chemotaxis protein CheY